MPCVRRWLFSHLVHLLLRFLLLLLFLLLRSLALTLPSFSSPFRSLSLFSVCVSRCLPPPSPPFPRRERSKCESTGTINSPLTCSWQSSRKNSISEQMLPKTVRRNKRCKGNGEDLARSCCSLKLSLCLHFCLSSISHFDLSSNLRTLKQERRMK